MEILRETIRTCPTKLNHPVAQEKNGAYFAGASMAAQKYGPPEVGMAETISAIDSPTKNVKNETAEVSVTEAYLQRENTLQAREA